MGFSFSDLAVERLLVNDAFNSSLEFLDKVLLLCILALNVSSLFCLFLWLVKLNKN